MRILVVEDTALARTMLERSLRKWGYQVDSVSNSHDAVRLLRDESIQFVITDWIMPGGDGSALCRDIRSLNLPYYIYIILVTSLESNESAIEGLGAGADDFLHKPIDLAELHARIQAGERVLALEKALQDRNQELLSLSHDLIAAQELINRELRMAAKVQSELLPPKTTKFFNITIDWLFYPSFLISGDIFNFLRLDETHVGFYSMDVAGHGVTAAMMSFTLFRMLTSEMQRGSPLKTKLPNSPYYKITPPAMVMETLNTQFQMDIDSSLYFTMVYGIINTRTHTIELCQAGHPSPIFVALDEPARFIGEGGFPVGLTEMAEYDSITLSYRPGERLVLYSDGITECVRSDGEMFGAEQLLEFLEENRFLPISEVSKVLDERIRAWRGDKPFEDDISMLMLEVT